MTTSNIIGKVNNMCTVLRDEGVNYGDFLEQITYLIFLKMEDEYTKPPFNYTTGLPTDCAWDKFSTLSGNDLGVKYQEILTKLGTQVGILGKVFNGAINKISKPAMLAKLVKMIGDEDWTSMSTDVKGDIYEGLLEKNAEDTKSGAGQYFTPRALIKAMVECLRPEPMKTIVDPACGTGGFLLAAHEHIANKQLNSEQKQFLKEETFFGWEIVKETYKLCLMNLFLHNIGDINGNRVPIERNDALINKPCVMFDYVLANPPFGRKSSMTFTNEEDEEQSEDTTYNRNDFWTTTSNKQLNFVQHIYSLLKVTGKAAVVIPDNVLFEGGAGETVRKNLLNRCELHTILRLPTGIFYKQGVKANVVFFDNKPASKDPQTKDIWVYDFRTNIHFTLKKNPLKYDDLVDFIKCYNPDNRYARIETYSAINPDGRWRKFTYAEISARDKTDLDNIFWIKDKSLTDLDNLPDPDILAAEIVENLEFALDSFREVLKMLKLG